MDYLYENAVFYHKILVYFLIIVSLVFAFFVFFCKKNYVQNIRNILPIFYTTIAGITITGFVLCTAIYKFSLDFMQILMIFSTFVIIGLNAASYKRLKIGYFKKDFSDYKNFMIKVFSISFILIFLTFLKDFYGFFIR